MPKAAHPSLVQGRVVFVEEHDAALACGLLKQLAKTGQRIGRHHGVDEGGPSLEQIAFLVVKGFRVDIVAMLPPDPRNLLAHTTDDGFDTRALGCRKRERHNRPVTPLAAQVGIVPDIEPVKEVGP